jgi:hypothetical protein
LVVSPTIRASPLPAVGGEQLFADSGRFADPSSLPAIFVFVFVVVVVAAPKQNIPGVFTFFLRRVASRSVAFCCWTSGLLLFSFFLFFALAVFVILVVVVAAIRPIKRGRSAPWRSIVVVVVVAAAAAAITPYGLPEF